MCSTAAIDQLDRRSLYTLLRIPNQLPPDGDLTLGKPVVLHAGAGQALQVLTFSGHKGESLLGRVTSPAASSVQGLENTTAVLVRVYGPDGSELNTAPGLIHGDPLVLPADGTYVVTVQGFVLDTKKGDVGVTIWDSADAPAAAKQPDQSGSTCIYTANSESCSSSSVGALGGPSRPIPTPTPTSIGTPADVSSGGVVSSSGTTSAPSGG